MRNVFDQYTQPENRLTHALAVCLHEDRALLRGFLGWVGMRSPAASSRLEIVEQQLPGDPLDTEDDAERKGLPDIVIHDGDAWCLLIESKIQASLTKGQLDRHESTLRRRGFERVHRMALTTVGATVPPRTIGKTWSGLYEWLGNWSGGEWARRLREYLRAAEVRLAREEYLTEGTLTMFDGFPFSDDNPYTYGEAKRLLKLALVELRKDKALIALGMDPAASGRGAITGRGGVGVWDLLSLKDRPKRGSFTRYPHLTLAVNRDQLTVAITIPNGVISSVRHRLVDLADDGIIKLNGAILNRAAPLLKRGAWVEAYAAQRHYPSQRSRAIVDANVVFKLETCRAEGRRGVKYQPEWAEVFAVLLRRKRSNIQFGYAMQMPWGMKGLDRRESLDLIARGWCAFEPLLQVVRS